MAELEFSAKIFQAGRLSAGRASAGRPRLAAARAEEAAQQAGALLGQHAAGHLRAPVAGGLVEELGAVHDGPALHPRFDWTLEEGMVVTIEPGVYVPGIGGVRIEDDIVVTRDGCDMLTTARRELEVV